MSRWAVVAVVSLFTSEPLWCCLRIRKLPELFLLLSSSSFIIVILHLLLTQKPHIPHHHFFHLADERLSSFIGFFLFFQLCSRRFKCFFSMCLKPQSQHTRQLMFEPFENVVAPIFLMYSFVPQRHCVSFTRCRRSNKTSAHFSSCVRRCQRISPRN